MTTCRFCAEDIKEAAIVCKHCGRNLSGAPTVVRVDQNWGGLLLWGSGIVAFLILVPYLFGS